VTKIDSSTFNPHGYIFNNRKDFGYIVPFLKKTDGDGILLGKNFYLTITICN